MGIRWAQRTGTFDEARELLAARPDNAAAEARKMMDLSLARIAETLKLRLPYLRGEQNDRRMAHEFLAELCVQAAKRVQWDVVAGQVGQPNVEEALRRADQLLLSYGNTGAHTVDVVRAEASMLIDACEAALTALVCSKCGNGIGFAEQENGRRTQCGCGRLRWRLE
jgi:hypothetical protein